MIREWDIDMPVARPNKLYREWMIAREYANVYSGKEHEEFVAE